MKIMFIITIVSSIMLILFIGIRYLIRMFKRKEERINYVPSYLYDDDDYQRYWFGKDDK
jgi:hypothetical protein